MPAAMSRSTSTSPFGTEEPRNNLDRPGGIVEGALGLNLLQDARYAVRRHAATVWPAAVCNLHQSARLRFAAASTDGKRLFQQRLGFGSVSGGSTLQQAVGVVTAGPGQLRTVAHLLAQVQRDLEVVHGLFQLSYPGREAPANSVHGHRMPRPSPRTVHGTGRPRMPRPDSNALYCAAAEDTSPRCIDILASPVLAISTTLAVGDGDERTASAASSAMSNRSISPEIWATLGIIPAIIAYGTVGPGRVQSQLGFNLTASKNRSR